MRKQKDIEPIFQIPIPDTTEMERQVLADVIQLPYMLDEIISIVHPTFFSTQERQEWWNAMVEMHNAGQTVDLVNLGQTLGKEFVMEVASYTANSGATLDTLRHAQLLRDGAAKRRAYFGAAEFIKNAVLPMSTEQNILSSMEQLMRSVEGPAPFMAERKLERVLDDVEADVKRTEQLRNSGKTIRISTGFNFMDMAFYGGFKAGQLVILAARPSVGKTAVMLQLAKAAAKSNNAALIFSLEMTGQELAERFIYSTGKVTPYQVTHGEVEWTAYEQASGELRPLPVYINDFSRSLDDIVTRMTQAVKQGRCKIAFIDYLGLMSDALNFGNAKLYQVIARITGTLKAVAKRLEIPIVLLCQLNRDQARENRSPEVYDLRDSGSIEQDADIVLMLEANPKDNIIEAERIVYAWLRKNRAGKKDMAFPLEPNETYSAFKEYPPVEKGGKLAEQDDLPEATQYTSTPSYIPPEPEADEEDDDNLPF